MKKPEVPNVRSRNNPNGGKVYYLDYYDPWLEKRERPTIGPRKKDAERKKMQIYQQMMDRFVGGPAEPTGNIAIEQVVRDYIRSKENRVAQSSITRYNIFATNFLTFMTESFPAITRIDQLIKVYVEEFLAHRIDFGCAIKTVNSELQFVKSTMLFAVQEGYLQFSPLTALKPFQDPTRAQKVKYWTIEEVNQILDEVKLYYHDALEFLYNTGLRKEEMIHLTWDDLTDTDGKFEIAIQAKDGWSPKTNRRRIIPLSARAAELVNNQTNSGLHNFIFKGREGGKLHHDRIYKDLKRALKKLGLEGNIHKFRHTFASHLVMKGAGLETVSKLLGHSSIEMTMKYAHLAPEHLRKAVDLLMED